MTTAKEQARHTAGPEYPNWLESHSLPWKTNLDEGDPRGLDIWIGNETVNVCLVPGYRDHPGNIDLANFIVHAANNHYALLEALEGCRNAMRADNPADGWKEIIEAADDALSAARGKS